MRDHLFPADPRRVGRDPDYRFTLANERTFLAWIRTSLALAAGGLAAVTILDDFTGEEFLGLGLLTLSFLTAATGYVLVGLYGMEDPEWGTRIWRFTLGSTEVAFWQEYVVLVALPVSVLFFALGHVLGEPPVPRAPEVAS
jgi:uncharacterized membrane protein YidH (DUF202 family)